MLRIPYLYLTASVASCQGRRRRFSLSSFPACRGRFQRPLDKQHRRWMTRDATTDHDHHPLSRIVLWRQKPWVEKCGHYLRMIRLPVVAYGIYTLGFQQGVIQSHSNPHKFQQELLDGVLLAHAPPGTTRQDIDVLVLTETNLNAKNARKDAYHQVATVAKQLIQQAKKYVDTEYINAIEVARVKCLTLNPNLTHEQLFEQVHKDAQVAFWHKANIRMNGDELNVDPWKFLFVGGNASPNAWVSEMLPKKIFITKSMVRRNSECKAFPTFVSYRMIVPCLARICCFFSWIVVD